MPARITASAPAYAGRRPPRNQWLTSACFSCDDGALYVCQYACGGQVVCLEGSRLQRRRVLLRSGAIRAPEGLVATTACLYVASACHGTIVQVGLPGGAMHANYRLPAFDDGMLPVPWGMAAPPGTACTELYVAVAAAEATRSYTRPGASARGCVMCIALSADGGAPQGASTFSHTPIRRPSGLAFDATGDLWVTSADAQLLKLGGPHSPAPGSLLLKLETGALGVPSSVLPWDVVCLRDGRLIVTLHNGGGTRKPPCKAFAAVAVIDAAKGTLQHLLQPPRLLRHPNMFAVQW